MDHKTFRAGECTTRFIDETPSLFELPKRRDRATRLLKFLADIIVNGNPLVKDLPDPHAAHLPLCPSLSTARYRLKELATNSRNWDQVDSPSGCWIKTAAHYRHHISRRAPILLATRFRTFDLIHIAEAYAHSCPQLFSLEMGRCHV
ncbi:MAG: hypothetical protein R3C28_28335 [Pirellulaceae bacterium]